MAPIWFTVKGASTDFFLNPGEAFSMVQGGAKPQTFTDTVYLFLPVGLLYARKHHSLLRVKVQLNKC